jgi:hypothetical protein
MITTLNFLKTKSFWILFTSLSFAHIIEDMVWTVLARYTVVPIGFLIIGIILWAFTISIFVKYLNNKQR